MTDPEMMTPAVPGDKSVATLKSEDHLVRPIQMAKSVGQGGVLQYDMVRTR